MTQTEMVRRTVPGAELFFGESVAQYLAEVSDEAYDSGASAEGFLTGRVFYDDLGLYVVVSGVTQDPGRSDNAVGWFRSSAEGIDVTQADIRKMISFFGYRKAYAIIIDNSQGTMAMYSVENGASRKVPSTMVENL